MYLLRVIELIKFFVNVRAALLLHPQARSALGGRHHVPAFITYPTISEYGPFLNMGVVKVRSNFKDQAMDDLFPGATPGILQAPFPLAKLRTGKCKTEKYKLTSRPSKDDFGAVEELIEIAGNHRFGAGQA